MKTHQTMKVQWLIYKDNDQVKQTGYVIVKMQYLSHSL